MSCHVCRCGDTAFCKCMCHTPPAEHAEAGDRELRRWKCNAGHEFDAYFVPTKCAYCPLPAHIISETRPAPAANTEGLREALIFARGVIMGWNGMVHDGEELEMVTRAYEHSPEIKRIDAALRGEGK